MNKSFLTEGKDHSFDIFPKLPNVSQLHCCKCDYRTSFKSDLKRHERIHTKSNMPFEEVYRFLCNECGKKFKTRYGLSLHRKGVHELQFRFECPICGAKFNTLWNYNGHVASHNQVLREKYENCEATFQYRKSLLRHNSKCGARKEIC